MHIGLLTNQNVTPPDSGSALGKVLPRRLWPATAGSGWGPLPELLLTLTLVTGLVDAVSILALGRVFVELIGRPKLMRYATSAGMSKPALMRFALKLMANLSEPRGGDVGDRLISAITRLAPSSR